MLLWSQGDIDENIIYLLNLFSITVQIVIFVVRIKDTIIKDLGICGGQIEEGIVIYPVHRTVLLYEK